MEQKQKRDLRLDACRAYIMIYIVCVIHVVYWLDLGSEPLRSVLLFEMPLIFFVAGAAQSLRRGEPLPPLRRFVAGRARRVLLPFYLFLPVLFLWILFMTYVVGSDSVDIRNIPAPAIVYMLLTGGSVYIPFYGYTWFISIYFIILCSFPLQARLLSRCPGWLWLAANAAVVGALSLVRLPHFEYEIKELFVYNFFFITGYLFYRSVSRRTVWIAAAVSVPAAALSIATGAAVPMQWHKFPADILFLVFGLAWLCALALLLWRARLPMPRVVALWNERGYTIYLWQIFAACAVLHATEPWLDARASGLWGFLVMALLVFAANTAISYAACAYERACLRLIGAAGRAARRLLANPPRNQ